MGDLSKNLSRYEMKCACCDFDTVDFDLVKVLQDCVDHFSNGVPAYIHISGGNRCEAHNTTIEGAAKNSQHIYGRAADFKLIRVESRQQIDPVIIYNYLCDKYSGKYGVGLYSNRCHVDTRTHGIWRRDMTK